MTGRRGIGVWFTHLNSTGVQQAGTVAVPDMVLKRELTQGLLIGGKYELQVGQAKR